VADEHVIYMVSVSTGSTGASAGTSDDNSPSTSARTAPTWSGWLRKVLYHRITLSEALGSDG
jgi:hypothetical protein